MKDILMLIGGERTGGGFCHVNGPTVHDEAQAPFGGKAGIESFAELRAVTQQTTPRHYPF